MGGSGISFGFLLCWAFVTNVLVSWCKSVELFIKERNKRFGYFVHSTSLQIVDIPLI